MPQAHSPHSSRADNPSPQWLLVSDLDGTLTGDEDALARFIAAARRTPALAVAINSSRPLASIDRTLSGFPQAYQPEAVIGAMGSQIRVGDRLLEDWPGDVGRWDRDQIHEALSELGAQPHEPELQAPYKVSYAVPPELRSHAEENVRQTGCDVQIVFSGQTDFDVIPARTGKAGAIRRLLKHFGLSQNANLIVAGDSGNDLAMFELAERGIVVGNARAELREAVDPERVVFAEHPYAAGVHEGLARWGVPIPDPPYAAAPRGE